MGAMSFAAGADVLGVRRPSAAPYVGDNRAVTAASPTWTHDATHIYICITEP